MTVIDHLTVCVVLDEIHILPGDVGPVQVGDGDILAVLLQPVPDLGLVLIPVQDLDPHLLQGGGIGLLMEEVIPQKFHHIALL